MPEHPESPAFPPIISVAEAARLLGISVKTYYRKSWPCCEVSPRKRRVIVAELLEAMRQRRVA